jgi:hypothetical protein
LARDLAHRPTRLGEIVDAAPYVVGTADASGAGMGGIWLSPDPSFRPILWRHPFPSHIQQRLVTFDNPTGSITNSDLELTAQIAAQDLIVNHRDCRERTIACFTDNVSARAWHRKGSATTLGPAAYLLRLHSLHQRFFRYHSTMDYLPGPLNIMANDASRRWDLSDTALLALFNSTYPQTLPWTLLTLRPDMFLPDPNNAMPIGFVGPPTAPPLGSTLSSPLPPIHFKSSKSLPSVTAPANYPPPTSLLGLVPWRQRSAPLARRWPAWESPTPASTPTVNPITCSNNN